MLTLSVVIPATAARPGLTAVFGSYDDAPSTGGTVAAFRNLLHHHVHQGASGPAETFWSGLGAVRREAFLAAGGFDADRFPHPSVEDIDLGVRLAANGAQILLDPTIQGTHLKAWTLRSMVCTDFARRGVPWVALLLRSGRRSTVLNLGWRHRLSAAACVAGTLAVLARRPRAAAASVLVLRWRRPDMPRPYRTLGYPVVPALFVLAAAALIAATLMKSPRESVGGLLLIVLGLPFYYRWKKLRSGA